MSTFAMYFRPLTHIRTMKTATWERDTHGLFDYDSGQLAKKSFKFDRSFRVLRDTATIRAIQQGSPAASGKVIASIGFAKGSFWVYDGSGEELETKKEPMLLVLRNYVNGDQPGVKLNQGDIVKMGRCRYLVKEFVRNVQSEGSVHSCRRMNEGHDDRVYPEEKIESETENNSSHSQRSEASADSCKDDVSCRICLCDENTEDNPIISLPCKCSGSVKFIHANCLKEWLKSKVVQKKSEASMVYIWKDFVCDVCKTPYPCISSPHINRCYNKAGWEKDRGSADREAQGKLHPIPETEASQRRHAQQHLHTQPERQKSHQDCTLSEHCRDEATTAKCKFLRSRFPAHTPCLRSCRTRSTCRIWGQSSEH
eukprot:TRINITY_DN6899_c0_g2_i2.p1 TRINITY_DN6899_c0_g2~~TRINITY_DN6899_c0_g2_i2.p1  ORF type:complete len:368 (-),score=45.76 TRINITY_DN6899_c0_g2_i2:492-1595(-)